MTTTANWTPTAVQDLDDIVYWIAVEDKRPKIAFKIAEELRDKADHFATIPGSGQRHPDLSNDGSGFATSDGWSFIVRSKAASTSCA